MLLLFDQIKWRPVIWGLGLQFAFGLLILRTSIGFEAFKSLGDQVHIFLEYTSDGAKFVFGNDYQEHFFAFKVLLHCALFPCNCTCSAPKEFEDSDTDCNYAAEWKFPLTLQLLS